MTRATATNVSFRQAWRFFHAQAGGIVGKQAETAMALARAEREAASLGIRFAWEGDPPQCEGDLGDHALWCGCDDWRSHGSEQCIALSPEGDVLASLGSILDADSAYRRLVEAELACEVCS